jgi:hypothetical protein
MVKKCEANAGYVLSPPAVETDFECARLSILGSQAALDAPSDNAGRQVDALYFHAS